MIVNFLDYIDDKKSKVNITMKNGQEFLGVDIVNGTSGDVYGFVYEGGVRLVNPSDVLYFDLYLDEDTD